jgi:hypothetical protein
MDVVAGGAHFRHPLRDPLGVDIQAGDLRAFSGKALGNRTADAPGGSGDHRHAARQSLNHCHNLFLLLPLSSDNFSLFGCKHRCKLIRPVSSQ